MSYKKQELPTLRGHQGPPTVFYGVHVTNRFSFQCFVLFCFVLSVFHLYLVPPRLQVSLDCPFLIVHSIFSYLYLDSSYITKQNVMNVKKLLM